MTSIRSKALTEPSRWRIRTASSLASRRNLRSTSLSPIASLPLASPGFDKVPKLLDLALEVLDLPHFHLEKHPLQDARPPEPSFREQSRALREVEEDGVGLGQELPTVGLEHRDAAVRVDLFEERCGARLVFIYVVLDPLERYAELRQKAADLVAVPLGHVVVQTHHRSRGALVCLGGAQKTITSRPSWMSWKQCSAPAATYAMLPAPTATSSSATENRARPETT